MGLEGSAQQADALRFAIAQLINEVAGRLMEPEISAEFLLAATDGRLGQIQGSGCRRHRAAQLHQIEGVQAIE